MRILYVASDQRLPGRTGGSVHVLEVARGLAARGHDVHAVVHAQADRPAKEQCSGFTVHRLRWSPDHPFLRFRARPKVRALARSVSADVVMERYYNFGGEGVGAAVDCGLPSVLEVNSPVVDHPGSWKARLDAVAVVRPMRRWREWQCAKAAALVAPLKEIVPASVRAKTEVVTWGANVDVFHPGRKSAARRQAWGVPEGAVVVLFAGSFRPWHGVHVLEEAARRLKDDARLFFVLAGGRANGPAADFRGLRLGTVPYEEMPEVTASADVGVAPYDTSRLQQLQLGFYWSPLKIFEYMASAIPTVTIRVAPLTDIVREGQEALFVREADPAALTDALVSLAADPARRVALGASARSRVVERYSWSVHCAQLETVLRRCVGEAAPVRIALVTEVFPPRAGGAGWSTRALGLGLLASGHDVTVLTTSPGAETLDGLTVRRLSARGRKRLAVPRAFAAAIEKHGPFDVVHAQHSLSALGSLGGLHPRKVVVTVRDHWPVCFWSTRISQGAPCPACGVLPMLRCVQGNVPAPRPLSWGALPYMMGDLWLKRRALARAGATLAVSESIAVELRRALLPRVEVVPNIVDPAEVGAVAAEPPSFPLPEQFLLFVGKLEENKGARLLVPAVKAARTGLPLVVLGEGSLHHALAFEAAAAGITLQLRGWADRADVVKTMARASALVFPSLWDEPLSRVLLEGLALGTPIAAMDTGGTREILGDDGEAGLVVGDATELGAAVATVVGDSDRRARLVAGARARSSRFAPAALVPRYEDVYRRIA